MTLEILQNEMIAAMKNGDKFTKTTISGLIAQIKKSAIDKGCRDNITEEFVNAEILRAEKQAKESIVGAETAHREDLLIEYQKQYDIIHSYAPVMIDNEDVIAGILRGGYTGEKNKGQIMKWLKANYNGKMDMKAAAPVVDKFIKE